MLVWKISFRGKQMNWESDMKNFQRSTHESYMHLSQAMVHRARMLTEQVGM